MARLSALLPRLAGWVRRPVRLHGLALCLQLGLCVVHWWWFLVLSLPTTLMAPGSQYRYFLKIGNESYWIHCSGIVAVLSTVALAPLPIGCCEVLLGAQITWFAMITILFALVRPMITGPGAYGVDLFFAVCLAVERWRTGRHAGRG